MINLLTAIDCEAKYLKWLRISAAASRLAAKNPADTRRVFVQILTLMEPL